jgi:SAM-dependent methyltransferase
MTSIVKVAAIAAGLGAIGTAGFIYHPFGAFLPWREEQEAARIADVAGIGPGGVIAEIGAGSGRFSRAFARRVGPQGKVYSTELSADAVAALAASAEREGLRNVIEVKGERLDTRLPDRCCDVIVLRNVYHHVSEPAAFAQALGRAIRDRGRLVIVDFDAGALWFHGGAPEDAPSRRPGHGVDRQEVIRELAAAGFTLERDVPDWSGPMWMAVVRATATSEAAPRRR